MWGINLGLDWPPLARGSNLHTIRTPTKAASLPPLEQWKIWTSRFRRNNISSSSRQFFVGRVANALCAFPVSTVWSSIDQYSLGHPRFSAVRSKCAKYSSTLASSNFGTNLACFVTAKLSWLLSRPLFAKSTSRNLISCSILAFSSSILFLCSSIWACILIFSCSICSGVILIISVGSSSNTASSNIFSPTMCSAIFLMSSCFFIVFWTFNSSFLPIFIISLFLSLSNFSMEGSLKKFSILSILFQFFFFQTVISTVILTVSTIFLFSFTVSQGRFRWQELSYDYKKYILLIIIIPITSPHFRSVTANSLKSQNGTLISHVWRRGRLALDPL